MHQVAVLAVLDRRGWLLLQERDEHAPVAPEQWSLPGGGVEPGETVLEAAHRELLEETGLVIEALAPVTTVRRPCPHGAPGAVDEYAVLGARTEATDAEVVCGEGRQMVFVDPDRLGELDLSDLLRELLPVVLGAT